MVDLCYLCRHKSFDIAVEKLGFYVASWLLHIFWYISDDKSFIILGCVKVEGLMMKYDIFVGELFFFAEENRFIFYGLDPYLALYHLLHLLSWRSFVVEENWGEPKTITPEFVDGEVGLNMFPGAIYFLKKLEEFFWFFPHLPHIYFVFLETLP